MTPRLLKQSLCILAGLLVLGYTGYQLRDIFAGPQLSIHSPANGVLFYEDHIVLAGTSKDIASLSVNGHQIYTDQAGNFSEEVLLLDGYNVIEVQATDKLNRTTTKRLELMLATKPDSNPLANVQEHL